MERKLSQYLHNFSHLRTDRTGGWDTRTQGRAPHKPILLLSVLDLFAQGRIPANLIEITPELGELFAGYWSMVMSPERRGNLALPFFHLQSSGFWHLQPQPGQEALLGDTRQVDRLNQLTRLILGASLDDELFQLLHDAENRDLLRIVLIQTYFSPEFHAELLALGEINLQAFKYSQHLIEKAHKQARELSGETERYQIVVRDQGLLGVTEKYLVQLSAELRTTINVPGHLLTLDRRSIIGPGDLTLWPAMDALAWHRQNVFRAD